MSENYKVIISILVEDEEHFSLINEALFSTPQPCFGESYKIEDIDVKYMSNSENAMLDTGDIGFVCTVFSAAVGAVQITDWIKNIIKGKIESYSNTTRSAKVIKKINLNITIPFFKYESTVSTEIETKPLDKG